MKPSARTHFPRAIAIAAGGHADVLYVRAHMHWLLMSSRGGFDCDPPS